MSDALLREHFAAKRARRVAFRDGRISARRVARLEARVARRWSDRTLQDQLAQARRIDADVTAASIDADAAAARTALLARRAGLL